MKLAGRDIEGGRVIEKMVCDGFTSVKQVKVIERVVE